MRKDLNNLARPLANGFLGFQIIQNIQNLSILTKSRAGNLSGVRLYLE